jgi:hypothetical protein
VLRLVSAFAAACFAAAYLGGACAQSHDLGVDTTSSGMGGGGGATTTTTTTGGATTTTGFDAGLVEPSGPTALTVVDGINDYDAIRICFLPGQTPWPGAAGLAFGGAQAVSLSTDLPAGSDVTPWVIAGDLSATAGMTCDQILALAQPGDGGSPPIVAAALGVIPQAVLASQRSLLLVPIGCMGGPAEDGGVNMSACGEAYSPETPTTGVVFVAMSRITDPAHVALQVVSAGGAFPTMDFRLLPNLSGAMERMVAPGLSQGAIGPYPPFTGLALADLGALPGVQLRTYSSGQTMPGSTVMLSDVLASSAVGASGVVNGAGLVLVAVGSAPGVAAGSFWHELTYTLIKADPG